MSASLIKSFGRTLSVKSALGAGEYIDGLWQEPLREDVIIIASVQDLNSKEILMLPEGDRQKGWKKLYSLHPFKVQKEGDMTPSDFVIIDGVKYMVMKVKNYVDHNIMTIQYFRADVVSDNGAGT